MDSGFSACGSKDKTAEQTTQTTITTTPAEATPALATSPNGYGRASRVGLMKR